MSNISRRSLALGLAASATLATSASSSAIAKSGDRKLAFLSVSTRKVGRVEVTAISDGFIDIPLKVFTGAREAEIDRAFAARFARRPDGTHRLGFTTWLVDDGERLVLIDSGYAGGAATTGRLAQVLATLGVEPQGIDAVLITHMHDDHTSGLIVHDRPTFPNAEIYIHRDDVAYFTDPGHGAKAPEILKRSFEMAGRITAAIPRLQRIDGERALTPAISTVDLRGHTPGHTGYRISDSGESLLIVGDALFDPAIHPARTDIGIAFEPDPQAAAAMRRRLFPQAAEERALLAATHMPFPGFGRILREGEKLAWAPADWELGS